MTRGLSILTGPMPAGHATEPRDIITGVVVIVGLVLGLVL